MFGPREHDLWDDETQAWIYHCDCPRHHVEVSHDPARWVARQEVGRREDGKVVDWRALSWPLCDLCAQSWKDETSFGGVDIFPL